MSASSGIVLLVPCALLLPPAESHHRDAAKHAPFGIRDLLTSRPFLLFMIATGFCQASHAVLYSFGTLTWRAAGIDDVTISLLWGLSVAVEIVLMLFSGRLLARLGVCGLIGLALGCGMVRWLGMAFTTELWALVPLQALHAGSFAACHLGAMAFIQRALPASGAALGQSVYYAIGTGATQAVIFQIAGVLYGELRPEGVPRHVRRQRHRHGGDRAAGAPVEGRAARRQCVGCARRQCMHCSQRRPGISAIPAISADRSLRAPRRWRPCGRGKAATLYRIGFERRIQDRLRVVSLLDLGRPNGVRAMSRPTSETRRTVDGVLHHAEIR